MQRQHLLQSKQTKTDWIKMNNCEFIVRQQIWHICITLLKLLNITRVCNYKENDADLMPNIHTIQTNVLTFHNLDLILIVLFFLTQQQYRWTQMYYEVHREGTSTRVIRQVHSHQ